MGQLLSIDSFFDYVEYQMLNHDVSHATCHNNQALHNAGAKGLIL